MKDINDFSAPLLIQLENDGVSIKLLKSFHYSLKHSEFECANEVIVVPEFFTSQAKNFNGNRLRYYGDGLKISILHDYLCHLSENYSDKYNFTRDEADIVALEMMQKSKEFNIFDIFYNYGKIRFYTYMSKFKRRFKNVCSLNEKSKKD